MKLGKTPSSVYSLSYILLIMSFQFCATGLLYPNTINKLETLSPRDPSVKNLRNDIRQTIYTVKSRRNPDDLPRLKFFHYRVKKNDTFWTILSRTSQNIDTLMTANGLSSPGEVVPGRYIFIPNMRGLIYRVKKGDTLESISKKFSIDIGYITKVNSVENELNSYLFIPGAEAGTIERSLFLGTGFRNPLLQGKKTSGFGTRRDPFNNRLQFHRGIDIACAPGTPIYAARAGKVVSCGYEGGYGLLVVVRHSHDYFSYYGHLSKIRVKQGDQVDAGNLIALSGNTGRTTGPHLHFEVRKGDRPINPGMLLKIR